MGIVTSLAKVLLSRSSLSRCAFANPINGDIMFELKPKAKRLGQSIFARLRRKKNKSIIADVLDRKYAKNRRKRKNK
tara:strand:- start:270 stop:500 length:231 start_codon:yes stop_codon:yes gene_type:complete